MNLVEGRIRVIGCGRSHRCDDQAGLLIAAEVSALRLEGVEVLVSEAPAADVVADLDGVDLLIVADAAAPSADRAPGTWERIDYARHPERIRRRDAGDSHTLSVDCGLNLASMLGWLPREVWVYAVTIAEAGFGEEMTPAVERAVAGIARQIASDIAAWRAGRERACA
ncbi:MAG: hydrogenase maturation protease [Phycisphaerae bacterium]|nr:hydrogenase maturation protease [Phycisphaerae bacterium]